MGSKRVWGCSDAPAELPFPPATTATTTTAACPVPPAPWGEWSNNVSPAKRHCASAAAGTEAAGPAAPQCWLPPQPQQHPCAEAPPPHVAPYPACGAAVPVDAAATATITPPPTPSAGRKRRLSETLECLEGVLGQLTDAQQQQAPAQGQFAPQRGPPAKRRRLRANIEVQESVATPGFVDVYIDPAYMKMLLPQFPHLIAYHNVPGAMPSASLPPQRVRFTLSAESFDSLVNKFLNEHAGAGGGGGCAETRVEELDDATTDEGEDDALMGEEANGPSTHVDTTTMELG